MFNGNTIQFTWHSSSKLYIFTRLDYFLVSNSLDTVCDCTIIPGFKSDHSIVTISIHFTNEQRGPGYFKINNSLLLQSEYQKQIKNTISETVTNNVDANPNVMGSNKRFYKKHNNSICFKDEKRKSRARNKLIEDINNLQRDIPTSNTMEDDVKKLQNKKSELQELQEKKVNRFIVRERAEYVEGGEKILSTLQI